MPPTMSLRALTRRPDWSWRGSLRPNGPTLRTSNLSTHATFDAAGARRGADEGAALLRELGGDAKTGPKTNSVSTRREEEVLGASCTWAHKCPDRGAALSQSQNRRAPCRTDSVKARTPQQGRGCSLRRPPPSSGLKPNGCDRGPVTPTPRAVGTRLHSRATKALSKVTQSNHRIDRTAASHTARAGQFSMIHIRGDPLLTRPERDVGAAGHVSMPSTRTTHFSRCLRTVD